MRRAGRWLLGVWALLVFALCVTGTVATIVLATLVYGTRRDRDLLAACYRLFAWPNLTFTGVRARTHVHGAVPPMDAYIVVSNHTSMIDITANIAGCPLDLPVKFLAKAEASEMPVFGYLLRRMCVLVDRTDKASRRASYDRMAHALDDGYSVLIYPEGTRNRTDRPLKDFYDGAFRLALETGRPLWICTVVGARALNPPDDFPELRPGVVDVHWEEPFLPSEQDTIETLRERTRARMLDRLTA